MTQAQTIISAEMFLSVDDLNTELPFFLDQLGFRLEEIFPADDPAVALISGHGIRLRLDRTATMAPGRILLRCSDPAHFADGAQSLRSPSGHHIEIAHNKPALAVPATRHQFLVRHLRDNSAWIVGRAGMQYRDLIPSRLGGSIIASHIRIPDGGPVPDMVHYHTIGFQLIFCYRGWVRLVYEDQGEPFILEAGNCVIQPPEIRHRVLEASEHVEVLEVGVPAEHITTIDHDMSLPNDTLNTNRQWQGTRFIHHRENEARWLPWRVPGWESRDTGIAVATDGVAGVHVSRPQSASSPSAVVPDPDVVAAEEAPPWIGHTADILFTFVKEGAMTLDTENQPPHALAAGDAFVVPPEVKSRYLHPTDDCELIEVSLAAHFSTDISPCHDKDTVGLD